MKFVLHVFSDSLYIVVATVVLILCLSVCLFCCSFDLPRVVNKRILLVQSFPAAESHRIGGVQSRRFPD